MNKLKEKVNCHQAPGIDDFELLKPISKGAFGHVYLVRRKGTDKLFAMKAMRKTDVLNKNMIEQVVAERDALAVTKSPFVVQLFYSFQSKSNIFLVMEYLIGGDCKSLLHNLGYFDEQLARIYIAEVTLALEYIHKHGIVHRDIKPDNMLISDHGHVKLTDFGLTRITRERKLNFHDLLQTPGTDKLTTPSQKQAFWRTPGQILSLTSRFTFSMPRSKLKPHIPAKRLACINSVAAESPSVPQANSQSAFQFNAPNNRRLRCTSSASSRGKRYPSLSTPKTSHLHRVPTESQSDSDVEHAIPIKHINFASPTNETEESDEPDVLLSDCRPVENCTGITGEFHNMLVGGEVRSCVKRTGEILDRDEVFVGSSEPRKKRVRMSSPVRFQLNSSSDDEVTFNPRTYFNSDSVVAPSSYNQMAFKLGTRDNLLPSAAVGNSTSPFSSPNDNCSISGKCNISGVTHLTDTTRMSIANSDIDELSLPLNDEFDVKSSPSQKKRLESVDILSPVVNTNGSVMGNCLGNMYLSPDNPTRISELDDSIDCLSPMEVYETNVTYHQNSSPVVFTGHRFGQSVTAAREASGGCDYSKPRTEDAMSEKADSGLPGVFHIPKQAGDSMEQSIGNCSNGNCSNCNYGGEACADAMMQSPASAARPKFCGDFGGAVVQSSCRTPANSFLLKGESQKRTPYRTPKSCRRGADAKECRSGCIIGTPDYLAPEILLDQDHGSSVDWWALGVCLYEFLTGIPPFNDETPELVFQHILNRDLIWPEGDEALSTEATDVVNKLLVRKISDRYGASEIKNHRFFATIDWKNLHKLTPPFVPNPDDAFDTTYFEARNNVQNLQFSAFRI